MSAFVPNAACLPSALADQMGAARKPDSKEESLIHLIAGTALLLALSAGAGCYRGDLEELRAQDEQILQRLAELEAGLDLDRFRRDLSQNKARYEAVAQEDFDQGRSVAVKGTPTLYVSGKKVQNRSLEAISAMIEEARREAGPGGEHVGQH